MIDLSHTPYNHNLFIRIQCFTKMRVFNEVFVTLSVLPLTRITNRFMQLMHRPNCGAAFTELCQDASVGSVRRERDTRSVMRNFLHERFYVTDVTMWPCDDLSLSFENTGRRLKLITKRLIT